MSILKRWFISLYISYVALASAGAFVQLLRAEDLSHALAWFGLLLSSGAPLVFFVHLFARPIARTSAQLAGYWFFLIPGALLSISNIFSAQFSLISLLGWVAYLMWYSNLEREKNTAIALNQPLPEIELQRADGAVVNSRDWLGEVNLLLFFRGNWCPLCMAQIGEIAAQYRELQARGVNIRLISPQPEQHTRQLAQRFDVSFDYLIDKDLSAARTLQIFARNGLPGGLEAQGYATDTVYPTVIITDAEGVVRYCDLTDNYRVRPEPASFLQTIDQLGLATQK